MLAVGNDELGDPLGDTVKCRKCGNQHPFEYGEAVLPDGSRKPSKLLAFYKCGGKLYLAGIDGKTLR